MRVYRFIDEQKAEFAIKTLCAVCGVPRSSYYDWAAANAAGPSDEVWEEAILADAIFEIWRRSGGAYGSPRVTAALWRDGIQANHKCVERIMAELGLQGAISGTKHRTTRADPAATPAPDLVERRFVASQCDRLWIGDVTYIATDEGWLYLASVLDVCSRRLVGWSMSNHLYDQLCIDALAAAAICRQASLLQGLIFHSDHGSQYTSNAYKALCAKLGITQSMGSVGDSYDNAMAESFFASLKRERVDNVHYTTRQEARVDIFKWIMWYNRERLHTSIGNCSPVEFEELRSRPEAA